jgi:hypothetical protein
MVLSDRGLIFLVVVAVELPWFGIARCRSVKPMRASAIALDIFHAERVGILMMRNAASGCQRWCGLSPYFARHSHEASGTMPRSLDKV